MRHLVALSLAVWLYGYNPYQPRIFTPCPTPYYQVPAYHYGFPAYDPFWTVTPYPQVQPMR